MRGRSRGQVEDGRFEADRRLAAIEDQVDPPVEVLEDVPGERRRDPGGTIGAGGGDRPPGVFDQEPGDRGLRDANADGVPAGGDDVGDHGRAGQDQGERARPERLGELSAASGHSATHVRAMAFR